MASQRSAVGLSQSDMVLAVVIFSVSGLIGWMWLTGQTAAVLATGTGLPLGLTESVSALFALPKHLADPQNAWPQHYHNQLPGPVGMWLAHTIALAMSIAVAVGVWKAWQWAFADTTGSRGGMATRVELKRALSAKAALAKAARLRPSLESKPTAAHVSVDLGKAIGTGQKVRADIENSVLMAAAPRQGKTSQVVIPWLTDWKGPALATSVRSDIVLATHEIHRQQGRPVAVMDIGPTAWPYPLTWSPVAGCSDYDKARRRAGVMVTVGRGGGDSTNAGFFHANAVNLLAAWLHAAALDSRDMSDVVDWALNPTNQIAVDILESRATTPSIAANLLGLYQAADETRSSLFNTVQTAIAPLLSDRAREVFCPPSSQAIDLRSFLESEGTMYLLVPEQKSQELAPLISAFVDEVVEVAMDMAHQSTTGRLDPPLGLFLDEVANITPLDNLPELMSYAAGSGLFVVAIFQELAQARHRWGSHAADMLWGAATVKLALGGLSGADAEAFSDLAGRWDETIVNTQYGPHGPTRSTTEKERTTLTPFEIRKLSADRREALVVHTSTAAVTTRMRRHYESTHKDAHARSVADTTAQIQKRHTTTTPTVTTTTTERSWRW
ncbi:type IV secretory system conjugative DNA transfer family protein [Haloglycomyces albus]|uniref:type IV secretory system conjugative DNA transfer family protein n=1 Tax=Haloglycomyces albus TaxID=526067 RepID=UPI00046D630B|nr:type IV secretory system conjugative DNA transfer family protein [Haloglycomyces albus]